MRTFDQLSGTEQGEAIHIAANELLKAITEGAIQFDDSKNGDNLQSRINAAWERAEKMQTPWFAHEYIMETCKEEIMGMAEADAQDALYADKHERVIRL